MKRKFSLSKLAIAWLITLQKRAKKQNQRRKIHLKKQKLYKIDEKNPFEFKAKDNFLKTFKIALISRANSQPQIYAISQRGFIANATTNFHRATAKFKN